LTDQDITTSFIATIRATMKPANSITAWSTNGPGLSCVALMPLMLWPASGG